MNGPMRDARANIASAGSCARVELLEYSVARPVVLAYL